MSFTTEVKEEMCRVAPVCSHCARAMLSALLRIEGSIFLVGKGKYRLDFSTDLGCIARFVLKTAHDEYGLKTDLVLRSSVLRKTPNYLIKIPAQDALAYALQDLGILQTDYMRTPGINKKIIKKQCCVSAYLRGVFLSSGFLSNPKGDFHFEMSVDSKKLADDVAALLQEKEINAKVLARKQSFLVYIKSGSSILEFLALTGAHSAALAFENERVVKSVRNDVNRMINAEVANQQKSSNAAVDQLLTIKKVLAKYDKSEIPPALQDFINLRLKNPEASLKELGEKAHPPLTKSAVYHRVRRLEKMAEDA